MAFQGYEIGAYTVHDLEVMDSIPILVELEVHSTCV